MRIFYTQFCFSLLLLFCAHISTGQKQNNRWIFGYHAGLDFNSSPPAILKKTYSEAKSPPFYTSTLSDTNGQLLFYTDGMDIWTQYNEKLPRYQSKWPWYGADIVMPLLTPYPENDTLFYLFGVSQSKNKNGHKLLALTINSAANLHTGGIVYPLPATNDNYYTMMADNAAPLLAGTAHCNQKDKWIVTVADAAVKIFKIEKSKIAGPISTPLPFSQTDFTDGFSNIRFSANGEKLAIPVIKKNKIIIFDFDNQTGACTRMQVISLPAIERLQDIEFSANGKRLYYASYYLEKDGPEYTGVELHNIFQLNLEAGNVSAIEDGRYKINRYPDRGGCPRSCYIINRTLTLAPDGKIYVTMRNVSTAPIDTYMNVIESPDLVQDSANYIENYIDFKFVYGFLNVNYIRSSSFSAEENGIVVRKNICLGLPTAFSLLFNKVDSVKWNFGDPQSANDNYSTSLAPQHVYQQTGKYIVQAIIYKHCGIDTSETVVSIDADPIVRIPDFIHDTIACVGGPLVLDASIPAAEKYKWDNGLIYPKREISESGHYVIKAYNACSMDSRNFTVQFAECPCSFYTPSAFTPNHDGLNDLFKPVSHCLAANYHFKIFNREGALLFASRTINRGWDGMYKNKEAPAGAYIWILTYTNPNTGLMMTNKGSVLLIR